MKNCRSFLLTILFFFISNLYAQTDNRFVSVTFDDLPFVNHKKYSPEQQKERTDKILNDCDNYKIPAVGFVNEYKLYDNDTLNIKRISVLEEWINKGFELGNHTFSHNSLNKISIEEYKADILRGEKTIKQLLAQTGKPIRYFRYPFLQKGNEEIKKIEIEKFLLDNNYINAPVTIDNSDWVFAKAYDLAIEESDSTKMKMIGKKYIEYMDAVFEYFERQSKYLFNREIKQILLLHASALNSDFFGELCKMMQSRGYAFISLEETLKDPVYKKYETYVGNWGFSWINRWAITDGMGKDIYKDEPEPSEEIFKLAKLEN